MCAGKDNLVRYAFNEFHDMLSKCKSELQDRTCCKTAYHMIILFTDSERTTPKDLKSIAEIL